MYYSQTEKIAINCFLAILPATTIRCPADRLVVNHQICTRRYRFTSGGQQRPMPQCVSLQRPHLRINQIRLLRASHRELSRLVIPVLAALSHSKGLLSMCLFILAS